MHVSRQERFCIAKKLPSGSPAFVLHLALCILPLVSFFSTVSPSFAASGGWAATYDVAYKDGANSIQQTSDGGYIVAGETSTLNAEGKEMIDTLVLKLRPDGTVEWRKSYGGSRWDMISSIQQTSDGGYVAAGFTSSFGVKARNCWVLKLSRDGTVEWQKTYGGEGWDEADSIQQTGDGGYIVAGMTGSFGEKFDFWVLKLGSDGTVEWQKSYGGSDQDMARSIRQTGDGGYIVAGMTRSFGAGAYTYDFLVMKLRPDGTVEWGKTYGGDFEDWGSSIQQTGDGGYLVAGRTDSFIPGRDDAWVLKLRPDGTVEWQKSYGTREGDGAWASSIEETGDGGYIIAGWTSLWVDSINNEVLGIVLDILVLKLRPDGTVEWHRMYDIDGYDRAQSVKQTDDGGYIVGGWTGPSASEKSDLLVLKLRPDGSIDPSCNLATETVVSVAGSDVVVLDPDIIVGDSDAGTQDSSATVRDVDVVVNFRCP
ncbi:MAG: hypothetical protein GY800_11020 [Planctomycetes bacterium]|nr:hypothetical protein [Planctomycetota bacterium]